MNKQEAKQYILKHFKTSSGKKIARMLDRYWKMDIKTMAELSKPTNIAAEAERIFNG